MERYGEICRAKIPQDPQVCQLGLLCWPRMHLACLQTLPSVCTAEVTWVQNWQMPQMPQNKMWSCYIVFGLLSGDLNILNDLTTTGSDQAQAMQSICKPSKHCRCSKRVWYFIILTWCFRNAFATTLPAFARWTFDRVAFAELSAYLV